MIPTIGRESLQQTIDSIEKWPGDEILVIQHNPPSGRWGNVERQEGTDKAKCDYIAYIDDDDIYVRGARAIMNEAIKQNPSLPILFKIKYPSGRVLPRKKWVKNGNVSTQMILVPNKKDMFWGWDPYHKWADFWFIYRWKWDSRQIVWRPEIIARLGHNDGRYEEALRLEAVAKMEDPS